MTGGVTRCRLPALLKAGTVPLTKEAFRELAAEPPEVCPHGDCSPGGCRAQVREVLLAAWAQRKWLERAQGTAAALKEGSKKRGVFTR